MTDAVLIEGEDRPGPWLVTCDHASNHVPDWVSGGDLGIRPEDMARHIAFDIGAWGVACALGKLLDSPVIGAHFSRLVIDPNRGEEDPTLIMQLYDGTIIPANRHLDASAVRARLDRLYRPYHRTYERLVTPKKAVLAIHSFTPCLKGRAARPWQIGVLYSAQDPRLSSALLDCLRSDNCLTIGDNQPYNGHLPGDAIDRHSLQHARHNTLIEIRNDLVSSLDAQMSWATYLAPLCQTALTAVLRG